MWKYFKNKKEEIFQIIRRIFRRDFRGYSGLAIKNSFYQFSTTVITNVSSLILLVILARILMPELFGLYSLALSTILLFVAFSNLGVGEAVIKYLSRELEKNNLGKAKAYAMHLVKIRVFLIVIFSFLLVLLSRFISTTYYNKPLFLALFFVGPLFIIFSSLISLIQLFFQAGNNFKIPFYKEVFSQIIKLIIMPLAVLYFITLSSNAETKIFILMLSLTFVWILTFIFFIFLMKRNLTYLNHKKDNLSNKEKKGVNSFVRKISLYTLAGLFLGYLDLLFLGRFVTSDYIGYYRVALSFIETAGPILTFTTVLFPIFSRLKGKRLEAGFRKSASIIFFISLFVSLAVFLISPIIVTLLYGNEYVNSINLLRILSLLIIALPLIYLYNTYFVSQGKIRVITKVLLVSTILNFVLNATFIFFFIKYNPIFVVYGICISTVVTKYFYLALLMRSKQKIARHVPKILT